MPNPPTDYSNTIIYKIYCKDERLQDVYVGHTTNFVKRKYEHMSCCMKSNYPNHNCKLYQVIRKNGNWDNWNMSIIAFYNCKDLNEAKQKEQYHYVELKATLNSVEPMRSVSIHPKKNESKKDDKLYLPPSMDNTRVCYNCKPCGFTTDNKTDYERHLTRRKHHENVKYYGKTQAKPEPNACPSCHKIFKHRSSVYKHKTVCLGPPSPLSVATAGTSAPMASTPTEHHITDFITKNQELTATTQQLTAAMLLLVQQNAEFQSKIMEMCKNGGLGGMTNSHNTITTTTTNSHNPTFNMNMFLNEKCKYAMNMKDFVNSIQLNMTDLENVVRLGYVESMSNIFIDNLQKTDIYKRPVHCSDVKRETLYVKENDQWEREEPNHPKMVNAVLAVEQKNVILVNEWAKANPRCMNSITRENETYFRLSKVVTDGEKDGNIDKVIRKVAKKVVIEKDASS